MNEAIIVATGKNPVNGGVTTGFFAGDPYKWILFTINADPGALEVVLDGAVGQGGIKDYKPDASEFAPIATYTATGVQKQYYLPTHLRFRIITGTNVIIRVQQRTDPVPEVSSVPGGAPVGGGGGTVSIIPFQAGNSVVVGNLTNYGGALYPVTTAHTFSSTFDPTKHGTPVATPGTNGQGVVNRGVYAPFTNYNVRDLVQQDGNTYSAKTSFTSGSVFSTGDWDLQVAKGAPGSAGNLTRTGPGVPTNNTGNDGDLYVNATTGDLYLRSGGAYAQQGNLKGPAGNPGSAILSAVGVPSNTLGTNGDLYVNTGTADVYSKSGGVWSTNLNIRGTQGLAGSRQYAGAGAPNSGLGVDGDFYLQAPGNNYYNKAAGAWTLVANFSGAAGTNGNVTYSGSTAPSNALGANGDYYINSTTQDYYVKASGTWGIIMNLKGSNGANGSSILNGAGVPSGGAGLNGDTYINTTNGDLYTKAAGVWAQQLNIKGTSGSIQYSGSAAPVVGTGVNGDYYLNTSTGDYYFKSAGAWGQITNLKGAAGANPLALPAGTLTGGTLGNLVLRVPGTSTVVDADRWMKTELKRQQFYWLDSAGIYWLPGALVPVSVNQTAGNVVALNSKTAAASSNWVSFASGSQPASLDFTSTLGYVEIGTMETTNQMRFNPRAPLFLDDNPVTVFNNFSTYPSSSTLPTDFTSIYSAFTYSNYGTTANNGYPYGRIFEIYSNDALQHAAAWNTLGATPVGDFLDGEIQAVMQHGGATGSLLLNARMTGSGGNETRVFASINTAVQGIRVFTQVAGAASIQVDTVAFTCANDTPYRIRFGVYGPYCRIKVWAAGTTEPATWNLTTYQTAVLGTGKWGPGVSGSGGNYNRLGDLGICQNFGSAPVA